MLAVALLLTAVTMLLLSACFAAAESALGVRSRGELYRMAEGSGRIDQHIRAIADDEAVHQNAMSYARLIAESGFVAVVTVVISDLTERVWLTLLIVTVVLLATTFIFVGVNPGNIGARNADRVLRFMAPLVRLARGILGPVAQGLIRVNTRVTERNADPEFEPDDRDLLSLVDRAAEHNLLEENERDYIHAVVGFSDTLAREVMVPRTDMVTVDSDVTVQTALEEILAARHSRMPVVADDADDVLGMVYLRDLAGFVHRYPDEASTAPVTRVMRPAMFVPDLVRADQLLQQMKRDANHLALTVDEYGGISGLVTLEDLIEELFGEIYDEHDRERPEIEPQLDGSFALGPRVGLSELGALFDVVIEDDDVDTVAGLLVKELGRLADTGDIVEVSGIRLEATETDRRHTILSVHASWIGDTIENEDPS